MKIRILKKVFEININIIDNFVVKNNKAVEDKYKKRALLLLLTFLAFIILGFIRTINNSDYKLGSKLNNDIIAYKKVRYKKDILDADLEKLIIKGTNPVYDKNEEIKEVEIKKFTDFLEEISIFNLNDAIKNEGITAKKNIVSENKNKEKISEFIEQKKLNLNFEDIKTLKENYNIEHYLYLIKSLNKIYDEGVVVNYDINKIIKDNELDLKKYEIEILKNFIKPNLKLNVEKTKEKISENIEMLKNNVRTIHKGDIIAKRGEVITPEIYDKIEKLGLNKENRKITLTFSFIFSLIVAIIFYFIGEKTLKKGINSRGFYPTLIIFVLINLLNQVIFGKTEALLFLIPYATISIIASLLTKDKIFSVAISFLTNLMLTPNMEWFIAMNLISIIAISNNEKLTNRLELIKNGFKIGSIQSLFSLIWGIIYSYDPTFLAIIFIFSLFSGFLTGMICLGIIPYFENTFKILTEIKLLELGDYSFPLLKRLLLEAPGTFYHSIMVGALAEQAAESIGANPTLARVGAYYHDIGKLKRPLYFVENQGGLENLHDNLNPSVSALILTSHPKDGFILAKQYGLPDEILKIIVEHHGTTAVQYFYYKAVEIGEKVGELDFRYVGPKPSSKEAAIVMLADTVEAAVRASSDKSREGIENTIRYLIKYKMDDNQLTDSELTFKDIEKIVNSFLTVLKAAYHERIKYPKINGK